MRPRWQILVASTALLGACARSPLGHPQLQLVSDDQMTKMGAAAFEEVKAQTPETKDEALTRYVNCVATTVAKEADPNISWQVKVFESKEINAFALPGGKIGVYTGMLTVAETPDELAAVLAHEVGHVIAKHANARVSAALATETGLDLTAAMVGPTTPAKRQGIALLGLGAQVGVLLPYSREQETEADLLGLDIMAKAGFEPHGALELWQRMQKMPGKEPPTFLSDHPSHEGRIEDISKRMPQAVAEYQAARQAGKAPSCPVARGAEHALSTR